MTRVKAAVVQEMFQPVQMCKLELEDPRADEVQVRMVASGVCHTDAVVRDGWIPTRYPVVLGHEGAGIVERVGSGVTHLAPGDHVILTVASCGHCQRCLEGHPTYCQNSYAQNFAAQRTDGSTAFTADDGTAVGSHFFGQSSFAQVSNVAVRSVVPIPEDLPLETVAPLGCGLQTGSGAVLNVLKPNPGASIVVFGTGAVGMAAVMAAVASRAEIVIAVDVVDSRLEFAKELGATHTINGASEDVVARVQEITGTGIEFAVDTTGNPTVFRQMVDSLTMGGHAGVIGASKPGSEGIIDLSSALAHGIKLTWVVEGDAVPQNFILELIQLWKRGDFPFDKLIKTYSFDDIAQAFEDSEKGITFKPVVVF
ncbi:MAG: NAD(P)-dependent alcohol dehydrogenase [Galactobacter sp.]